MTIRPIRSDEDYQSALEQAHSLIVRHDKRSLDDLEVLQAVIEKWEKQHHGIEGATPAQAIHFRMNQMNLSPRDLLPYLGSKSRVSEILNGQRQPTVDQIRALNQHLKIPVGPLVGSVKHEPATRPSSASIAAAKRLRALRMMKPTESLSSFVSRANIIAPAVAMLRKTRTERTNAKTDLSALEAWCAAVLLRAEQVPVKRNVKIVDWGAAARKLAQVSTSDRWQADLIKTLNGFGIVLIILEHFPGTYLDGAAMCRADGTPVIALTLRHDRLDNFWFTLLHEFAHVACHLSGDTPIILDDLDVASEDKVEKQADRFATDALIPETIWARVTEESSSDDLLSVAEEAGVHPAIAAGRWRFQYSDYRRFSKLLGPGQLKAALTAK
ncbi:ImmA/IrrE family metallo-endopeptidase [Mesorhizobium sp. M0134]|uniref:ImmA/IrrE family metallo-endopeptidase n=1 Tax=Mesorhizobium sp. M0134 TaxID=2956889 RepID=UPI00333BA771